MILLNIQHWWFPEHIDRCYFVPCVFRACHNDTSASSGFDRSRAQPCYRRHSTRKPKPKTWLCNTLLGGQSQMTDLKSKVLVPRLKIEWIEHLLRGSRWASYWMQHQKNSELRSLANTKSSVSASGLGVPHASLGMCYPAMQAMTGGESWLHQTQQPGLKLDPKIIRKHAGHTGDPKLFASFGLNPGQAAPICESKLYPVHPFEVNKLQKTLASNVAFLVKAVHHVHRWFPGGARPVSSSVMKM